MQNYGIHKLELLVKYCVVDENNKSKVGQRAQQQN
jgi:hypothetical protein